MKKNMKFYQKVEDQAFRAICWFFNYGGVIFATLIEVCVLTETIYNIALAQSFNPGIAAAGAALNILSAALLVHEIKEVKKAKEQSTQL